MSVPACNALTARWARRFPVPVLSAASVYPLLALLATVAGGVARDELLAVAPTPLALPVRGALGIWTRDRVPLTLDWAARADPRLTGDAAVDGALLDGWVSAHTDGLISAMPVAVGPETGLVLASALSVVTEWRLPFTDGVMRPSRGLWAGRRLASLHRRSADVAGLRVVASAAGPLTLVAVAGSGDLDVLLCLGRADRPPGEVLAAAVESVGAAAGGPVEGPGMVAAEVAADDDVPELVVKVPRFTATASHDLLAEPELFGLAAAAATGPFPGISPADLRVGAAVEHSVASFSAGGFRAAAVAGVALVPVAFTPPRARKLRLTVTFDRPFGYLAVHRPTGLVLVAGWVTDPEPAARRQS
ncbi:serpin family protein [Dactylosporangium sp. AC04546]|uniref:serpin family protein n=1 Tax=Dactylosporangium sp. AC04546 TaxID=2862460 RepID=UPI001EDF4479|nr:serpin family protein [Dactylosporangium sp. AC04546]WVK82072.1 serpin family protein [Dactylosporangium sp. AC04546]